METLICFLGLWFQPQVENWNHLELGECHGRETNDFNLSSKAVSHGGPSAVILLIDRPTHWLLRFGGGLIGRCQWRRSGEDGEVSPGRKQLRGRQCQFAFKKQASQGGWTQGALTRLGRPKSSRNCEEIFSIWASPKDWQQTAWSLGVRRSQQKGVERRTRKHLT